MNMKKRDNYSADQSVFMAEFSEWQCFYPDLIIERALWLTISSLVVLQNGQ